MPRGGRREGAGRKPRDESGAVQQVSIWLSPAQIERLRALGETYGVVMELGLRHAEKRAERRKK
jgi:hypothetical protein